MSKKIYNSKEWRQVRLNKLSRNPLCEECLKVELLVPAKHVDHIKSIADGGDAFYMSNLRALCVSCHSRKTVYKDGGFGRKKNAKEVKVKGCGLDGMPIDPNHPWSKGGGV